MVPFLLLLLKLTPSPPFQSGQSNVSPCLQDYHHHIFSFPRVFNCQSIITYIIFAVKIAQHAIIMLWLCYHHFAITGIQVPFMGLKLNCIIVITNMIMIISNISFVISISIMITICIATTHQTLNHYNLCHICERALLCSMNTYIYIYGDSYLERYPSWEISTICTKSALTIFLIITRTPTTIHPVLRFDVIKHMILRIS